MTKETIEAVAEFIRGNVYSAFIAGIRYDKNDAHFDFATTEQMHETIMTATEEIYENEVRVK